MIHDVGMRSVKHLEQRRCGVEAEGRNEVG
jgi:hypothetical protein